MRDNAKKNVPRRRVLNPRAALLVLIIAASGYVVVNQLHDRQFGKTLQFLRAAAFDALRKEDYRGAQRQLTQYLAMKPSDLEAREKLSWLLTEHIRTRPALEQAFRLNEELLRNNRPQDDLRLRQAGVAVELSLMSDAEAHLKLLQTSMPDNSGVWFLSSRTAIARRDTNEAVACLKRAVKCPAPQPEGFAELARLATDSTAAEFLPDALMQDMVAQCPGSNALQLRAEWLIENGRIGEAIQDLWTALEDSPDSLVLNSMLVQSLQNEPTSTSDPATARFENKTKALRHLQTQTERFPLNTSLRLCLAAVQRQNMQKHEAVQTLEDGIRKNARAFFLHEAMIEYLVSDGDAAKARRILQSIPDGSLPRSRQLFCEGRILMAEGQWKKAADEIERCLAFAEKGSGLYARVQMSLAVCRSNSGETNGAIEAFRSVIESDPESLTGRLGIAAAWVRSGQLDLAVAEYRQMLNVPGVPAYLADILIQETMRQPAVLRDWSEIDRLIREDKPLIPDPVQRILLRADRLFASGQITLAITAVEQASQKFPDRPEIDRALKHFHGEHTAGLRDRLLQLAQEEPDNTDVHAAIVRQHLADGELSEGLSWLEKTARRSRNDRDREIGLQGALSTLEKIVSLEKRIPRTTFLAELQKSELHYTRELTDLNSDHHPQLARVLVRAGRTDEALKLLHDRKSGNAEHSVAAALLEIVRFAPDRGPLLQPVMQELYAMISRQPENIELRLVYADLMLFAREYPTALQTLEPLRKLSTDHGRMAARHAWILAVQGRNLAEAFELAKEAISTQPGESAYQEVQSRVLIAQEKFPEAVGVLNSVPVEQQSLAGRTYLAKVLLMLDLDDEARLVLDDISIRLEAEPLFPADEDLLNAVRTQLRQPATP